MVRERGPKIEENKGKYQWIEKLIEMIKDFPLHEKENLFHLIETHNNNNYNNINNNNNNNINNNLNNNDVEKEIMIGDLSGRTNKMKENLLDDLAWGSTSDPIQLIHSLPLKLSF